MGDGPADEVSVGPSQSWGLYRAGPERRTERGRNAELRGAGNPDPRDSGGRARPSAKGPAADPREAETGIRT